jgi:hypothetical protein
VPSGCRYCWSTGKCRDETAIVVLTMVRVYTKKGVVLLGLLWASPLCDLSLRAR